MDVWGANERGEGGGETYRPVGCSYLPAWGVSRVAENDIVMVDALL